MPELRATRRGIAADLALIVLAWLAVVVLFAALRRLGLPFGLRIGGMGEDYNWDLVLRTPKLAAEAQAFWAMNDRNPLSPWWYILARPLYMGLPNGPFLTRLLVNPLLAIASYAAIRVSVPPPGRPLALAVGLLVAISTFSSFLDEIHWNFLGAMALTLLCVASFGQWLRGGRRVGFWYGAAMCLWFAAFASYTFQAGAILAIGMLSLAHDARAGRRTLAVLGQAVADITPFAALFVMFVLVWTTTRNPAMSAYYDMTPGALWANLPKSLAAGLWPARYAVYWHPAVAALHGWLIPIAGGFGLVCAAAVGLAMRPACPRPATAALALGIAVCMVVPTILIESMSATWSVGMRWLMVDQAWQPMLWIGLGWLAVGVATRLRRLFPVLVGLGAACAVTLSLGHNFAQNRAAATEAALRDGVMGIVAEHGGRPLHIIVLVQDGVPLLSADVMNIRTGLVWFGNQPITLRTLKKGAQPTEPAHAVWWNVQLNDADVGNVAIGGGSAPYSNVVFARFDGARVTVPPRLDGADIAGYPAQWHRHAPITQDAPAAACARTWPADRLPGAEGFRPAEAAPAGAFRWMVANPATMTLVPGCTGAMALTLDFAMALDPAQWQSLTATLDGTNIPLAVSPAADGAAVARGTVPAGILQPGRPASLALHIDGLRPVPGTPERLGLALRDVGLAPANPAR